MQQVRKFATGGAVSDVSLGLDVLEPNAGAETTVEHVKYIGKMSRIGLARIAFDKGGASAAVVDPVQDLSATEKVGQGKVRGDAAGQLTLSDLLRLRREQSDECGRENSIRVHEAGKRKMINIR